MPWQPFHVLDIADLLPLGWDAALHQLIDAPERQVLAEDGSFAVVDNHTLRERAPWLWPLYHETLRDFAGRSIGAPMFACNRLGAANTLNILTGVGTESPWHTDANAVTGVLFVTPAQADGGGDLLFRDGQGRAARLAPRPGLFVCFEGAVEHAVAPLTRPGPRLSIPMVYYRSATAQQPAYDRDVYTYDPVAESA